MSAMIIVELSNNLLDLNFIIRKDKKKKKNKGRKTTPHS